MKKIKKQFPTLVTLTLDMITSGLLPTDSRELLFEDHPWNSRDIILGEKQLSISHYPYPADPKMFLVRVTFYERPHNIFEFLMGSEPQIIEDALFQYKTRSKKWTRESGFARMCAGDIMKGSMDELAKSLSKKLIAISEN